jgi:hypothetical protein
VHILLVNFYEQAYKYGFNENSNFQMVGPTRSTPNGFGASDSGDPPPPPPITPAEAFMVTQTEVLRQLLQMQLMAQQLQQRPPHGANHDGPHTVTTYAQFIGMKPPTFVKVEEPLEANAWGHRGQILCICRTLLKGVQGQLCDLAASW